jgi:hypothetical protein
VAEFVPPQLADRMVVLGMPNPSPAEWASAALDSAEGMLTGCT